MSMGRSSSIKGRFQIETALGLRRYQRLIWCLIRLSRFVCIHSDRSVRRLLLGKCHFLQMKARAMTLISFLLSRTHPHPSTMVEKSERERNIQKEVRAHLERQPLPLMRGHRDRLPCRRGNVGFFSTKACFLSGSCSSEDSTSGLTRHGSLFDFEAASSRQVVLPACWSCRDQRPKHRI